MKKFQGSTVFKCNYLFTFSKYALEAPKNRKNITLNLTFGVLAKTCQIEACDQACYT